jgi:hypothetical protein
LVAGRESLASTTVLALVGANLVPLVGALFLGWDLGAIMLLYWAESAIIGIFNLGKMLAIGGWSGLLLGAFFVVHFGGFMAGHFIFIRALFLENSPDAAEISGGLPGILNMFLPLWPALLALSVSHGYSFFVNFLGPGEYHYRKLNEQMTEPYSRIVLMHLVVIFGGALSMAVGEATPALVLLIAAKIAVDVRAHLREHREEPVVAG